MIRRKLFLSSMPRRIFTKTQAFEFESGKTSLTNRLLQLKLKVLIVGANGKAYEPDQWGESFTFRRGTQQNKMVSDNQTRSFDKANGTQRMLAERWTWGPIFKELDDPPNLDELMSKYPPHRHVDDWSWLPNPYIPLNVTQDTLSLGFG
jgi:hypothetical protein